MLVEGRHFDFKLITPWQLGAKTMAVNISDCAAMGAKPTVARSLPRCAEGLSRGESGIFSTTA